MSDFTGFRFGNIHTKDLHLVVVSSSDRYEKNLLPELKDYSMEVPGGNGSYYFGSTFGTREFTCNIAFDSVDEKTWRKISNLFATDKLQDLVFDELPYKTYKAKLKSKPEFKFICFTNRDTKERVYKGEGTLNFICYSPFAFGFNKYIIRAADAYLTEIPKDLPNYDSKYDNPYEKKEQKVYNTDTKEYYNVEKNMNTPWKGGYPTIEQVRAGELYFNSPEGKKIIDVRRYFRNVPEWAASSKLLTTPTLDYDQDLIFMPQYSRDNNINMDIGFTEDNALIGSRLLVYNPGDLPIDFELKLDNKERTFHNGRGDHFQIRRYNVQRMPIMMAEDLTGLQPIDSNYNFFELANATVEESNGVYTFNFSPIQLGDKHPTHCYMTEPIPREQLGHFIRTFYWQSAHNSEGVADLDFEEGIRLADRYEELYKLCIDEYEQYELYWTTLKDAILSKYSQNDILADNEDKLQKFIYSYIHKPPECIRRNPELYYGEIKLNLEEYPQWFASDYFDITTEGIQKATLFLDTDKRMLYNIINPEIPLFDKRGPRSNFYNYKPNKEIYNDNIKQGHWFKLPPGWSLIEIAPVCDENEWGQKRWEDARAFDWGWGGEDYAGQLKRDVFNQILHQALTDVADGVSFNEDNETEQYKKWYKTILKKYDFPIYTLDENKCPVENVEFSEEVQEGIDSVFDEDGNVNLDNLENITEAILNQFGIEKANGEKTISIADAQTILTLYSQDSVGMIEMYSSTINGERFLKDEYKKYDITKDGVVDFSDASLIIQIYSSLMATPELSKNWQEARPEDYPDLTKEKLEEIVGRIEKEAIYVPSINYKEGQDGSDYDITNDGKFTIWDRIEIDIFVNNWLLDYKYSPDKKDEVSDAIDAAWRDHCKKNNDILGPNAYSSFRNRVEYFASKNMFYIDLFSADYYKTKLNEFEYDILKTIQKYWKALRGQTLKIEGTKLEYTIKGSIDEWFWCASNYFWETFPPLQWGYADMLTKAEIKYTPLFY